MYRTAITLAALCLLPAQHSYGQVGADNPNQKGLEQLKKLAELPPEDFIRTFDKNQDGGIQERELPMFLAKSFTRLDMDGNGQLSLYEVDIALQFIRQRLAGLPGGAAAPKTAEVEKQAKSFLQKLDANGDGKISKDEAQGRLADNFGRVDANGDGSVDLGELRRVLEQMQPQGAGTTAVDPKVMAIGMRAFQLDANGDGKISRDEAQGPLAERFTDVDANSDGFLDRAEIRRVAERLVQYGGANPGAADPQPGDAAPDFDTLDKNADGRLTAEELRGTPLARQFARIDANGDGRVTPEEFARHFQKEE